MSEQAAEKVAKCLATRTSAVTERCKRLGDAYIEASVSRALSVTTAAEPPPTAMKSSQVALLICVLDEFGDVPTPQEIAALLRITLTAANSLLSEVLATSDNATEKLLLAVFSRAIFETALSEEGVIPSGEVWRFATLSDLKLARGRLEFRGKEYRTLSTADGLYQLLLEPGSKP